MNSTVNNKFCKCSQSNSVCSKSIVRNEDATEKNKKKRQASTSSQQVSLTQSFDLSKFQQVILVY